PRVARINGGMAFDMDFVADVTSVFRRHLVGLGYNLPFVLSGHEVRIRYWNLAHRLIQRRPRVVRKSRNFTCPPALEPGLQFVENKIRCGDDLRPHLSKGILKTDYSDALLNDWGIYHLHLGTSIGSGGFAARTGPVLFALFRQDHAYLIDVKGHG